MKKKCSECGEIKDVIDFYDKHNQCKDCCMKKQREYQKTERGREAYRKAARKYRRTPKGHDLEIKRRQKEKSIKHDFTLEEWEEKVNKTRGICSHCGEPYDKNGGITLDHIVPVSKVSYNTIYTIDDVQPLCRRCNQSKGNTFNGKGNLPITLDNLKNIIIKNTNIQAAIMLDEENLYEKVSKLLCDEDIEFTKNEIKYLNEICYEYTYNDEENTYIKLMLKYDNSNKN